jgi:cation diffusion facilitator CzcD-associated flavoprotein CzcO
LALVDRGVRPLVVDGAEQVAAVWRTRYDRLRLNTCRWFSHLPGRRFAKGTPMFPSRDQLIAHLEESVEEAGLEFAFRTRVERIERSNGGWALQTGGPDAIRARQVVVATGHENGPTMPAWATATSYRGTLIHSSEYRNPEAFAGKAVLVVGPGCSGMEIAHDLAEGGASKVWLAVRTPPNIALREGPGGFPGDAIALAMLRAPVRFADAFERFGRKQDIGDLTEFGLPLPEEGLFARFDREGTVPSIVDKEVIEAIRERRFEIVAAVEHLDATGALLADGSRIEPGTIVCATGFRPGLEPLVGHLGVLAERGLPRSQGAEAPAPGLRFIGFTTRPGVLGYMGKQARRAARAIKRELDRSGSAQAEPSAATNASSSVAA